MRTALTAAVIFAVFLPRSASAQLTLFTAGAYQGDGGQPAQSPRSIGINLAPAFLVVKPDSAGPMIASHRQLPIGEGIDFTNAATNTNERLGTSTGNNFFVKSEMNESGVHYDYFALRQSDGNIETQMYTGDGGEVRQFTTFKPAVIMVLPRTNSATPAPINDLPPRALFHTSQLTRTLGFDTVDAGDNNIIEVASNGFTAGSRLSVPNVQYLWVALADKPGFVKTGRYSGDGAADRVISGLGFVPALVLVKCLCDQPAVFAALQSNGPRTMPIVGVRSSAMITTLQSDQFSVGNSPAVNDLGSDYVYFAMSKTAAPLVADAGTPGFVDGGVRDGGNIGPDPTPGPLSLSVAFKDVPSAVFTGSKVTVVATIVNQGPVTTGAGTLTLTSDDFDFDFDFDFAGGRAVSVRKLVANENFAVEIPATVLAPAEKGEAKLRATVDADNLHAEADGVLLLKDHDVDVGGCGCGTGGGAAMALLLAASAWAAARRRRSS